MRIIKFIKKDKYLSKIRQQFHQISYLSKMFNCAAKKKYIYNDFFHLF